MVEPFENVTGSDVGWGLAPTGGKDGPFATVSGEYELSSVLVGASPHPTIKLYAMREFTNRS